MAQQAHAINDTSHHQHHHRDGHTHAHGRASRSRSRLRLVLVLTALYMLAEAFGGWWTGSLALLADAGHMLADVAALALALVAMWFSARPATSSKTFGYYRLEILAALINGVALILISLLIFYEAYHRLSAPPAVKSTTMTLVAAGGLIVNLACAWLLHGDHEEDLNVRGAWLHIIGDALGSVGAITAGALMSLYGWYTADPLFSFIISLLIVWSSWNLIRESTNVLLEGTPAHINLAAVEDAILETRGVEDVHDLHIWTITSGREALSAHVIHAETISQPELLKELRAKLHDRFGVDHLTIQMETPEFEDDTFHFCHAGTACFRSARD
ncbi:MAG TPA: cation diffusion facilitator family transporter [Pyrinomonadaceae bacterium]|jgi:cobalt-zinc-cadmium efflux system protein|nr:cation diffusion facilitator family transporter [Pyrinomonadaceae bacterium]